MKEDENTGPKMWLEESEEVSLVPKRSVVKEKDDPSEAFFSDIFLELESLAVAGS